MSLSSDIHPRIFDLEGRSEKIVKDRRALIRCHTDLLLVLKVYFFNEANVQSIEINSEISSIFYTHGSVGPQPHHPRVPNELQKSSKK